MHYLDELLMLYRGRDARTRQFFLGQMGDVPIGFDSDALVDLLWTEVSAREPAVACQARLELGRLLPVWQRFECGLEAAGQGVWTAAYDPGSGGLVEEPAAQRPELLTAAMESPLRPKKTSSPPTPSIARTDSHNLVRRN